MNILGCHSVYQYYLLGWSGDTAIRCTYCSNLLVRQTVTHAGMSCVHVETSQEEEGTFPDTGEEEVIEGLWMNGVCVCI